MLDKIKKVFSIVGAICTIAFSAFLLSLLCRRKTDRRGSNTVDGADTRVEEGLSGVTDTVGNSSDTINNCTRTVENCSDTVRRCEERLQRAEEILRNAINRSREEQ